MKRVCKGAMRAGVRLREAVESAKDSSIDGFEAVLLDWCGGEEGMDLSA